MEAFGGEMDQKLMDMEAEMNRCVVPMVPIKRKGLSTSDKKRLLMRYDAMPELAKKSQREAADQLSISKSCLHNILKNRDQIMQESSSDRKRKRSGKAPELERALGEWVSILRDNNIPITGKMVRAKSEELALEMNITGFKFTEGWFTRFKKREGLLRRQERSEPSSMEPVPEISPNWLEHAWPVSKQRYTKSQIWCADESAFYFRALPGDGFESAGLMEKISVMFACSLAGAKRNKLLVIGKDSIATTVTSVEYNKDNNAWMTPDLFQTWLVDWDRELRHDNEEILLLVGECSAHNIPTPLSNIQVILIPRNTIVHPCRQGIVQFVKTRYRQHYTERILHQMDSEINSPTILSIALKFTVEDAMELLVLSWEDLDSSAIRNGWRKSGLESTPLELCDDDFNNSGLMELFSSEKFKEYVNIDMNLGSSDPSSEEEAIVQAMLVDKQNLQSSEESVNDIKEAVPSDFEMREAWKTLKSGLHGRGYSDFRFMNKLERVVFSWVDDTTSIRSKIDRLFPN